jgi:hypothetical protein
MFLVRLAMIFLPKLIVLRKTRLNLPLRKRLMDIRPITPPITSMLAHNLTHQLLDYWHERLLIRLFEARIGEVGSLQASIQRAGVVPLRKRHLRVCELASEKCVVFESLMLALFRQVGVRPVELAVAVEFGPVIVPGFGAVFCFAEIVLES